MLLAVLAAAAVLLTAPPPEHILTFTTIRREDHSRFGWREAGRWVTWVSLDVRDADAAHAAGMRTMRYADPNLLCSLDEGCIGDPSSRYITDESAFEHCNGGMDREHRVTTSYDRHTVQWVGNLRSAELSRALRRFVRAVSDDRAHPFDAIWIDDVVLPSDRWPPKTWQFAGFSPDGNGVACSSFPWDGYRGDAEQLAAWRSFFRSAPLPVIIEGLGAMGYGPYVPSPSHTTSLIRGENVIGAIDEGAWGGMNEHRPKETPPFWQKASNDQIAVVRERKLFILDTYTGARDTDVRGYVYASFLLTYDPRYSVFGEYNVDGYPSHLSVPQETMLVPMSPLQTAVRDVEELRVSGGAYRREFARCFIARRSIGPCAVVVNPDPNVAVPFPALSRAYRHSLRIVGAGVLPAHGDDGRLLFDGPPPARELPASGWVVLAR